MAGLLLESGLLERKGDDPFLWKVPLRQLQAPRNGSCGRRKSPVCWEHIKVIPLKLWVGQFIAVHTTLTARDFFGAYFYPSGPFTCIFFQNLSRFLLCWLWLTHGSCVGPQNEIGYPAGCRFPCWVPAEYKAPKYVLLFFLDLRFESVNRFWVVIS